MTALIIEYTMRELPKSGGTAKERLIHLLTDIRIVMALSISVRFLFCFSIGSTDVLHIMLFGLAAQNGINPYTATTFLYKNYSKFPGLFFGLIAVWFTVFPNIIFSVRILLFIFNIGANYLIYLLGKEMKNAELGALMALLFAFSPPIFLMNIFGVDTLGIFFELAALYYLLKRKYGRSALMIALGINYAVYPIILLIPIFIFFLKNKEIKYIFYYIGITAAVFTVTSLYYLLSDPSAYINGLLTNLSRKNDGPSFIPILSFLYGKVSIPLFFLNIEISYNLIFQLSAISAVTLYYFLRPDKFGYNELLCTALAVHLLTPLIFHQVNFRNWYWILTFLILYPLGSYQLKLKEKLHYFALFFAVNVFIMGIIMFSLTFSEPYGVFTPITDPAEFEIYIYNDFQYPGRYIIYYFISNTVFLYILARYTSCRTVTVIGIIITVDWPLYFIMLEFAAGPITLNPIILTVYAVLICRYTVLFTEIFGLGRYLHKTFTFYIGLSASNRK